MSTGQLRIVGGSVHDPANAVDGEVRDICVENERIVSALPEGAPTLDARGMIVMPGGVDIHSHLAILLVTVLRVSEGAHYHIQTHLRVDEILAGACVATLFHYFRPGRRAGLVAWVLAAVCWFASAAPYGGWLLYARPYATALVLMATLCSCSTIVVSVLSIRTLKYVATTSYALYIFHPLSTFGWLHDGTPAMKYLVKRPISFLITFACAHISTFYFERPILDAIKRALRNRHQVRLNAA